jgi:hypothetical protein
MKSPITLANDAQHKGFDYAFGALLCVAYCWLIGLVVLGGTMLVCQLSGCGMDDSDTGPRRRSGLRIHTDAKTGIQYLSDGKGGLIERR